MQPTTERASDRERYKASTNHEDDEAHVASIVCDAHVGVAGTVAEGAIGGAHNLDCRAGLFGCKLVGDGE